MTAYTSFVAIDTQARLQDGKGVTVKQPIPLPRGVSDYAVGTKCYAEKIRSAAVPLFSVTSQGQIEEKGLEYKKEDGLAGGRVNEAVDHEKIALRLAKISVTQGLSKKSVKKAIEGQLASINDCWKEAAENQPGLTGEIACRLVIDSMGRVTTVSVDNGAKKLKLCIAERLKKVCFPLPEGQRDVVVTFTLTPPQNNKASSARKQDSTREERLTNVPIRYNNLTNR